MEPGVDEHEIGGDVGGSGGEIGGGGGIEAVTSAAVRALTSNLICENQICLKSPTSIIRALVTVDSAKSWSVVEPTGAQLNKITSLGLVCVILVVVWAHGTGTFLGPNREIWMSPRASAASCADSGNVNSTAQT